MSNQSHCLHPLLPTQRNNKVLNCHRNRVHNYLLPQIELTYYLLTYRQLGVLGTYVTKKVYIIIIIIIIIFFNDKLSNASHYSNESHVQI